ncbi:MAG: hypothetical protein SFU85_04940 [Candidatus Methylacidiphilales bacterium]|nr:hypothetical protein [Candidatus Methylacidiphilales bacterium]
MISSTARRHSPLQAFTLVELLVVVVILILLAALGLPTIRSAREKASATKCASNLRQIGIAMQLYVGDNDYTLPGVFWTSARGQQSYVYSNQDSASVGRVLARYLQPYLNTKASTNNGYQESDFFKCPSYMQKVPASLVRASRVPYIANNGDDGSVKDSSGNVLRPFGVFGGAGPMKITSLATVVELSKLWALQDLDEDNLMGNKPGWIPSDPIHGSYRNTLFFDGHVEAIKR